MFKNHFTQEELKAHLSKQLTTVTTVLWDMLHDPIFKDVTSFSVAAGTISPKKGREFQVQISLVSKELPDVILKLGKVEITKRESPVLHSSIVGQA